MLHNYLYFAFFYICELFTAPTEDSKYASRADTISMYWKPSYDFRQTNAHSSHKSVRKVWNCI